MNNSLIGHIESISEEKTFKNFSLREFTVNIRGSMERNIIPMKTLNNNNKLLDYFKVGDYVNIEFDLEGREWNGKNFVNLVCRSIENINKVTEKKDYTNIKRSDISVDNLIPEESKGIMTKEELDTLPF